ncbi:MAG TPA: exosortase H-associated membrane protein [Rhodanobacteraceae bacterium]|nr:exosortase H-associated membrane protein [Rhodanobacteraceae bacterium]
MSADSKRLKGFLLAVLVWLPLAFIGWAVLAPFIDYPPARLAGAMLSWFWPGLYHGVEFEGASLSVISTLLVPQDGRVGQLVFSVDPMMYGYGLPLYVALAMATPLTFAQRVSQCVIAGLVVWLVQIAGILSSALRLVAFDAGPVGQAAIANHGLSPEVIALCYQFSYLILPAVLPAVVWVLLNRRFIEPLGRARAEPGASARGLSGE